MARAATSKVWLLMERLVLDETETPVGVYSTHEKAEEASMRKKIAKTRPPRSLYYLWKWEIDESDESDEAAR